MYKYVYDKGTFYFRIQITFIQKGRAGKFSLCLGLCGSEVGNYTWRELFCGPHALPQSVSALQSGSGLTGI